MIARVLLDTGPLVALLASDDSWHEPCAEQLRDIALPLLTTWPVLAEADWLLRSHPQAVQQMLQWVHSEMITLVPMGEEAMPRIGAFLRRYRKAQIADASLVYLAEQYDTNTIFTLDRRDFATYRFGRNRAFRILPERAGR